jgi:NADPH:quinone reductase-like Zn-dependent oxidoreductase
VWGQTTSAAKVEGITANGADRVVVTGADGLESAVESFEPTVILDSLGGPFTDAAIAAITKQGRLVVYGTSNERAGVDQPSSPVPQGCHAARLRRDDRHTAGAARRARKAAGDDVQWIAEDPCRRRLAAR